MNQATRKRYSAEFKSQAVGLVELGKPVSEVAEDLGIGSSLIYGRLRRENAHLKLENGILKKAAVILGTKPQLGGER